MRARCQVLLTEETAMRAIQFRCPTKGFLVAPEGRRHMDLVRRISLQYFILRDQALRALGKEHLVAELDRRPHLAPLDQIGMGFENGIDLLGGSDLLSVKHTTARLIDHTASQPAKMLDLLADFSDGQVGKPILTARPAGLLKCPSFPFHYLFSHPNRFSVFSALLMLSFVRAH